MKATACISLCVSSAALSFFYFDSVSPSRWLGAAVLTITAVFSGFYLGARRVHDWNPRA